MKRLTFLLVTPIALFACGEPEGAETDLSTQDTVAEDAMAEDIVADDAMTEDSAYADAEEEVTEAEADIPGGEDEGDSGPDGY
ncbi:hypothetical protein [Alteriqipengyuania lutimaris]|nr:hypothetical protein [Alteriqipengyuania lutimaris]MBB3034718.1 uncharacterized protein YcfL [Alteriqipengyuania lutimaris]